VILQKANAANMSFDKVMEYLASIGVEAVEMGCGGFPGNAHCDPEILLNSETEFKRFQDVLKKNHLVISALGCHGNALHPDKEVAGKAEREFRNAVLLAEKLGVGVVNTFSGCPGDCPESKNPNWIVCAWPNEFQEDVETCNVERAVITQNQTAPTGIIELVKKAFR